MNTLVSPLPSPQTGLVLGKFMPLHTGHEYLLRFAAQCCENLVVVVDCLEGQTHPPELRKAWVEAIIPSARVVALTHPMPQQPSETPDFWRIWSDTLLSAVGRRPDVLIASMDYGVPLSEALQCSFVRCDMTRASIPISATQIRDNPLLYWDYLSQPARPYYLKKICLMGPESTGKSTSAEKLAKRLNTVYVPEYAKSVIESQNGNWYEHNVIETALHQYQSEKALSCACNRFLICDTDPLTNLIWSEFLYQKHPKELDVLIASSHRGHVLLFDTGTPWVDDIHRKVLPDSFSDDNRKAFLELCKSWLEHFQCPYSFISGSWDERFEQCYAYCQSLTSVQPLRQP